MKYMTSPGNYNTGGKAEKSNTKLIIATFVGVLIIIVAVRSSGILGSSRSEAEKAEPTVSSKKTTNDEPEEALNDNEIKENSTDEEYSVDTFYSSLKNSCQNNNFTESEEKISWDTGGIVKKINGKKISTNDLSDSYFLETTAKDLLKSYGFKLDSKNTESNGDASLSSSIAMKKGSNVCFIETELELNIFSVLCGKI